MIYIDILCGVNSPNNQNYHLTEIAGDVSISHVAWAAHADHCSLRQSVLHGAVSVLTTGGQDGTGVPADLIEAGQPAGTVSVDTTLGFRGGDWKYVNVALSRIEIIL